MTWWPEAWDTVTEIRQLRPDGTVIKVTVEQPVTLDAAPFSGETSAHAIRTAAKLAAIEAFKTLDLPALVTPGAIRGTDPETRMSVSAYPAERKDRGTHKA